LTPYVRERLADPKEGLGAPLEFSIDPSTVTVRGAAAYASCIRPDGSPIARLIATPPVQDRSSEAQVTQEICEPDDRKHVLEADDNEPDEQSTTIPGEEHQDATESEGEGSVPDTADEAASSATVVLRPQDEIACPRVAESIGVGLPDNRMQVLFATGTSLPARRHLARKVAALARNGQTEPVIRIDVLEGNSQRADRSRKIAELRISASQIKREVAAGSDVEFLIDIDSSHTIRAKAFIPSIGETYADVLLLAEPPDRSELRRRFDEEIKRLETLREKTLAAQGLLARIDRELLPADIDSALGALEDNAEAADMYGRRLLSLQTALDELEEALAS
jgi:molecular chaperone DnaK